MPVPAFTPFIKMMFVPLHWWVMDLPVVLSNSLVRHPFQTRFCCCRSISNNLPWLVATTSLKMYLVVGELCRPLLFRPWECLEWRLLILFLGLFLSATVLRSMAHPVVPNKIAPVQCHATHPRSVFLRPTIQHRSHRCQLARGFRRYDIVHWISGTTIPVHQPVDVWFVLLCCFFGRLWISTPNCFGIETDLFGQQFDSVADRPGMKV